MIKTPGLFFLYVLMLVCFTAGVGAEDMYHGDLGWGIHLPETWVLSENDSESGFTAFADQNGEASMFVLVVPADTYTDADSMLDRYESALGAIFERSEFSISGHDAALGYGSWTNGGASSVTGYAITINDSADAGGNPYPFDYLLLGFADSDKVDTYHDFILSVLDSFIPIGDEMKMPGPINQYIRATGDGAILPLPGATLAGTDPELSPDPMKPLAEIPVIDIMLETNAVPAVEAAYATIEREARILQQYISAPEDIQSAAWNRFYRIIYKDSWYDMMPIAEVIANRLAGRRILRSEYPSEILSWIQDMEYNRAGGLSDLEPSWICLYNDAGDCDSLALLYMAVLDHLGIDTILMVSPVHSHSLVGVDIGGPGARYSSDGVEWLVAELTVDVAIGQIAADQANPADWLGFSLEFGP